MVQQIGAIEPDTSNTQDVARIALGLMLLTAGTSHLTFAREPFKAQVPPGYRSIPTRTFLNRVSRRLRSERRAPEKAQLP
jgi:hypothetical protein